MTCPPYSQGRAGSRRRMLSEPSVPTMPLEVVDRQPHLLAFLQPQQHAARADLLAAGHVVAEGGHLEAVAEQHAQVGRSDVWKTK